MVAVAVLVAVIVAVVRRLRSGCRCCVLASVAREKRVLSSYYPIPPSLHTSIRPLLFQELKAAAEYVGVAEATALEVVAKELKVSLT